MKNPEFFPQFTKEDKAAVQAVLDRGDLMSGREVAAFEEELAAYFGKRHAVCVSSGTAALECAFVAANSGHYLHPHNFIAAISASMAAWGIIPLPAEHGMHADILGEEVACSGWVHDCAHRFDRAAAHAEVSCFSFNANKFIACCGGVVVTESAAIADFIRAYRNHGREGAEQRFPGRHLRMGEINAALGRSQLKRIGSILERRDHVAAWYDVRLGQDITASRPSWFLYPFKCPHKNHGFRSLADFRILDSATITDRRTALLPIYPHMTRADVDAVVACLRERKCL